MTKDRFAFGYSMLESVHEGWSCEELVWESRKTRIRGWGRFEHDHEDEESTIGRGGAGVEAFVVFNG